MSDTPTQKPPVPLPHSAAAAVFDEAILEELREAQALREAKLKQLRTSLEGAKLFEAVADLDVRLRLHTGDGPTVPGLKAWFGPDTKDNTQTDLEDAIDKPDYRSWQLTVKAVQGLVAKIANDEPPAAALRSMNRLDAGEKERKGGPRDGALEAIRSARSALKDKVEALAETAH